MDRGRMRRVRRAAAMAALGLTLPLAYVGWNQLTFNFAIPQPGRLYRSGQMHPGILARTLRKHGIKTVVNLRGPNHREAWYRDELAATLSAGATQVDIPLSSCVWMSRIQLRTLIQVLETCEYPTLVHCSWGSERTGLVSAMSELLHPGRSLSDARAQLSAWHLYVRLGDGKIMAEFLDEYEDWLRSSGLEHQPKVFRDWAERAYAPRSPSREEWPYDPFPLSLVTRPVAAPEEIASGGAAKTQRVTR
jgi:protein tyrosine phosphatase (PTP) superfamily phosphohydrolase (DUF442 family)